MSRAACPRFRLRFYQNIPSPHQVAVLRALEGRCGASVELFIEKAREDFRVAMGWAPPDFGPVKVTHLGDQAFARRLVRFAEPDTVHVFSGTSAYPLVRSAFEEARRAKATIGVMAESFVDIGVAGVARALRGRLDAWRVAGRVSFVLAMGQLAVKQYVRAGFPQSRVFPYGYFINDAGDHADAPRPTAASLTVFKLAYVGQLVHRKGPDVLLRALGMTTRDAWRLDMVGDGPLRASCESLVRQQGLQRRVRFLGNLPHQDAMAVVRCADALVCPSRWDGWGVVVNEALMNGVPVICTSTCGAADLIVERDHGLVVPPNSPSALARALDEMTRGGPTGPERRAHLREWSKRILGQPGAEYLLGVVQSALRGYGRPTPPWRVVGPLRGPRGRT